FCLDGAPTPSLSPLSLHDALPISGAGRTAAGDPARRRGLRAGRGGAHRRLMKDGRPALRGAGRGKSGGGRSRLAERALLAGVLLDRKSTRLNSSHVKISYAVFCLK